MARCITVGEAEAQIRELVETVRRSGEPVLIGQDDTPIAALVSIEDLRAVERLRDQERRVQEFSRAAGAAAANDNTDFGPSEEEEEIVRAVKATREAIYRERYGRT